MATAGVAGPGPRSLHGTALVLVAVALAGCAADPRSASRAGSALELAAPAAPRMIERDVPAPEVFDLAETGLWDGRPSLGGVWVAHPDAADPERVSIRNTQTGAEVIGALFRRERENPGPRFQISSEAAAALGIVAGQPTAIQVVALRLERIEPEAPPAPVAEPAAPAAEGAAPPAALPPVAEAALPAPAPAPVSPDPALSAGSVATTAPDAPAPRRGLLDMFRRSPEVGAAAPAIAETTLEPVAPLAEAAAPAAPLSPPLAATALLAGEGAAPQAPAAQADPGRVAPDGTTDFAEVELAEGAGPRFSLAALFRRSAPQTAPQTAPEASTDPALIPLPVAVIVPAAPAPTPAARAPSPDSGAPARPFVQVGIFAVEGNADRTAAQMRAAGLPADIRAGRSGERDFWRVVVGPARDAAGQADLLARARALGFGDAYTVAR